MVSHTLEAAGWGSPGLGGWEEGGMRGRRGRRRGGERGERLQRRRACCWHREGDEGRRIQVVGMQGLADRWVKQVRGKM